MDATGIVMILLLLLLGFCAALVFGALWFAFGWRPVVVLIVLIVAISTVVLFMNGK